MSALALDVAGVHKSFGGTAALTDAHLRVRRGTIHALLGGNGSGKSTLIKILAGVHRADAGTIAVNGRPWPATDSDPGRSRAAGLRFVHQDLGLVADLTVAENIALDSGFPTGRTGRIRWSALHDRVTDLLGRFDIDARPGDRVGSLRPAQRTMVAIARALQDAEGDLVLVLDEPTASLPQGESDLLLDAVRRRADDGQTVIIVSHRMHEVMGIADDFTVLRDGRVAGVITDDAPDEESLVELIAGGVVTRHRRATPCEGAGAAMLEVKGLSGGPVVDLDLQVGAGEVVGLAGLQGSGRSSVLCMLFGAEPVVAGELRLGGETYRPRRVIDAMNHGVALVPEDRAADAAFADLSLCDNMSASVIGRYWRLWLRREEQRSDTRDLVDAYAVKAPGPLAPFFTLSGGNQQKAVVARWLRRDPRLLLLDEPTQGVDVIARADIYRTITESAASGSAVVIASSDLEELEVLCDRVVVLRAGRIAGELVGARITAERITQLAQSAPTTPQPEAGATP